MMRVALLLVALILTGCGTHWRFRDLSSEPLPREELHVVEPFHAQALCDVAYVASRNPYGLSEEAGSETELRHAVFVSARRDRLVNALLVAGIFEEAQPQGACPREGVALVRVQLEESRGPPAYPLWLECGNGYAFAIVTGLWVPLLPLWIVQSHDYRTCEPDLRVRYALVVSQPDGVELARYETQAHFRVEEQEYGSPEPDPLLRDPHRAVLDAAFARSLRVLLARFASDRGARERIAKVIEGTRSR